MQSKISARFKPSSTTPKNTADDAYIYNKDPKISITHKRRADDPMRKSNGYWQGGAITKVEKEDAQLPLDLGLAK